MAVFCDKDMKIDKSVMKFLAAQMAVVKKPILSHLFAPLASDSNKNVAIIRTIDKTNATDILLKKSGSGD